MCAKIPGNNSSFMNILIIDVVQKDSKNERFFKHRENKMLLSITLMLPETLNNTYL